MSSSKKEKGSKKKPRSPAFYLILGLIYFIWPFDFPTFIDDIIVNIITGAMAVYALKARSKVEDVVKDKTGYDVNLSCVDSMADAALGHAVQKKKATRSSNAAKSSSDNSELHDMQCFR